MAEILIQAEHIERPGAELILYRGFIEPDDSRKLLARLTTDVSWRQDRIRLFGRDCQVPRLQQFQGNAGLSYRYSGLRLQAQPWHPQLEQLRKKIAIVEPTAFNCVLLNLYRDGSDSMGWHSDDEPELGPDPVIASVSLGQTRRFVLRHRGDRHQPKIELELEDGMLLLMRGSTQRHWQHALPRTRRIMAPRINLTFRRIIG